MKKNLNKIPPAFTAKIADFATDNIVVATVKVFTEADIVSGALAALNVNDSAELLNMEPIIPAETTGRYCKKNIKGYSIRLRHLPKIKKSIYMGERPIFGDWSNGSFSLYVTREVYRQQHIAPRLTAIGPEVLKQEQIAGNIHFTVKIATDEVLNRTSDNFEDDLLFNLNLLQETVGQCDVYPSDTTSAAYLQSLTVSWELLPLGQRDQNILRILSGYRKVTPEIEASINARYDFLESLKPIHYVYGVSSMHRYFGAQFSDNLIVFENLQYGNAAYVMFENWKELSKLSRTELLKREENDFIKVEHRTNWQERLRNIIKDKLAPQ